MLNLLLYLIAGFLGISNIMLWGLYGDLLLEPFSPKKMLRSLIFGFAYSIYLYWVDSKLPLIMVVLIVITFERVTTEIYKFLLRAEKQTKYKIPSDLNVDFPRLIEKTIGLILVLAIILGFKYMNISLNLILLFIIAIFIPALGGLIKDAPFEGFHHFKFFRSPIVVLVVGSLLFKFFSQYGQKYLLFSIWGGERIISEFYKKVLSNHVPGKFKRDIHHHINHSWKEKRKYLLIPYAINLVLIVWVAIYSAVQC